MCSVTTLVFDIIIKKRDRFLSFVFLIRFATSFIIPAFVNFATDYHLVALYCVITWKPTSHVPLAPAFATS